MTNQKGSVLNKLDYDEIDKRIRNAIDERFAFLPTKKEFFDTSDKLMVELKAIREDFAAHQSNHDRIEANSTNLTHKVKHLYKIFEVEEPAAAVPAY